MLFIIESLLTQGLIFFITLGESLYYFFMKQEIRKEEPLPLWGLPISVVTLEHQDSAPANVYTASVLTTEQEQFFEHFLSTSTEMEDCRENNYVELVIPKEEPTDEIELLSMSSWEEIEPQPITLPPKLSAKADCKINDAVFGKQLWVVEVVGEEQGYLHVSDGSGREWVNGTIFNSIQKGDKLSILVERNEENHIQVLAINILQKYSTEFSIEEMLVEEDFHPSLSHVVA